MSSETTTPTRGTAAAPTVAASTYAPAPQESAATSSPRPVIIGIYGVPGSGKSHLLKGIENFLKDFTGGILPPKFNFYDGSEVIAGQVPGGLGSFQDLNNEEKYHVREAAIKRIQAECYTSGKAGVIAGHYSFWFDENQAPERVMTTADTNVYTHIVYLNTLPDIVLRQIQGDTKRQRQLVSVNHLSRWQKLEQSELREICYKAGILFSVPSDARDNLLKNSITRLRHFASRFEPPVQEFVSSMADSVMRAAGDKQPAVAETALIFDADRTIAPEDSGKIFWELAAEVVPGADANALKTLFGSQLGYSDLAFRQAMILYQDVADDKNFHNLCDEVAGRIVVYPEIKTLFQEAAKHEHVVVAIVTCGLATVWEAVLKRNGISDKVKVIGLRHTMDRIPVTPEVKKEIVAALERKRGLTTWVFGDSPIDIPMLREADYPIIVVGDEQTRSKSMDKALSEAVDNGFEARQALLPKTAAPRLDTTKLPIARFTDPELTTSIFRRRGKMNLVHATGKAASKLLATPTRDAEVSGPRLREAHDRVGWYLATEFVTEHIGTEEFPLSHVQGGETMGFRLKDEAKTLIVALMRAGEPMASGVNKAFPTAMFLHAKEPCDLVANRIKEASTILLVDGVVNQGTTAVKFIRHIRRLDPDARVVIVTGVIQGCCVGRDGGNQLSRLSQGDKNLSIVALRISDNRYIGRGTVDTGNRLFNTTHFN